MGQHEATTSVLPYTTSQRADRGAPWAITSLTAGIAAWVLGFGLALTFSFLIEQRLLGASQLYQFRFIPGLSVLIGGPVAVACGIVALLRGTRRKPSAVGGCVLGVAAYAVPIVFAWL